jgi:transposase
VPESHLARVIDEVVEILDTSIIEEKYSRLGQKSYHPKSIIKLLFYGYSTGVMSGRKIAQHCESDTAFMYLARMYRPDFRTINDFRKNNLVEIENYFVDIVRLCKQVGMVKAGTIIIDSTKLRANASGEKMHNKVQYEQMLTEVEEQIKNLLRQAENTDAQEDTQYGDDRGDELPEELRSKKKLKQKIQEALAQLKDEKSKSNLTDPDARFMRTRDGVKSGYCCQVGMSEDGIIVGAYANNTSSDKMELLHVIHESEKLSETNFPIAVADSGYSSYEVYEQSEREQRTVFMPDQELYSQQQQSLTNKYHSLNFTFDQKNNQYICPEGKPLPFYNKYKKKATRQERIVYRGRQCDTCTVKPLCTTAEQRQLSIDVREPYRTQARERLKTELGQRMQKLRRCTIERLFGHIKHNLKFTMFQLRKLKNVTGEFKLVCMTYNLRKLHQAKLALI